MSSETPVMKFFYLVTVSIYAVLSGCSASRVAHTDSVEIADSANKTLSKQSGYDKAAADFLVDAADTRLMDIKESRTAVEKAASPEVRKYARLMVREQTKLLVDIRKLAAALNLTLPAEISNTRKEEFSQLPELGGSEFDDKFIKMMIADHERDVQEFKAAQNVGNPAIAEFATQKLPVIESHLNKIYALRDLRK